MKNLYRFLFALLIFVGNLPAFSQIVSKEQSKTATDAASAKEAQQTIDFSTSRNEDILMFENNMKLFENAVNLKSVAEAEVFLNKNNEIAAREIARAKINLADLKAGNTQHLDKWRKENGETEPLNISLEINRLNDNINSMQYRYNNLKKAQITNLSDTRATSTWLADMRIILKNMNKNLKYESDKKVIQVDKLPGNDAVDAGGTGIITQNQPNMENEGSNLAMNDFYTAQTARIAQFKQEKSNYETQLQANDYKLAKRTYKSILQLMQSEIDANIWLKNQKDEESNKLATINVDEVSPKIAEQQKIWEEAGKLKVPTAPNADFDPAASIQLLGNFEKTLN